jgi:hypothetical protein
MSMPAERSFRLDQRGHSGPGGFPVFSVVGEHLVPDRPVVAGLESVQGGQQRGIGDEVLGQGRGDFLNPGVARFEFAGAPGELDQ